jgi:small subunit ribosomal protein S10e
LLVSTEGTLVAPKDTFLEKHSEALPIPNVEVVNLLKSFKSKGFVRETFNWRSHYYYLTNEGIEYLREYLALPADIVPATLKETAQRPRTGAEESEKKNVSDNFKPEFRRERREYRK